jgi:hypothetical protein
MIQKNFDAITKADIDSLIANEVNESKTIEYKQTLPGKSDGNKKEFLADVSSFANASGGNIIYGIKEDKGKAKSICPIAGVSEEEAKLRLEDMILEGINPRIRIQIKEITGWGGDGNGFVILLRISKSFASPHMVTYKKHSRFYSRNSAGKYQLDVGEIRGAFLATESQADRIKRFRQDRLGQIVADEAPVVLSTPHRLILHMVPVSSFLNNERLDLSDTRNLMTRFEPIGGSGWNCRHNLDGLLICEGEKGRGHNGYCQLFFNGAIEAVSADILREEGGKHVCGGTGFIASIAYEKELIEAVQSYLKGYKQLDLIPPVVISLALIGCKGSYMYIHPRYGPLEQPLIDRDTVILPDVEIDDFDIDVPKVMKPIFDAVWNACGLPHSYNYDENGNWKRR